MSYCFPIKIKYLTLNISKNKIYTTYSVIWTEGLLNKWDEIKKTLLSYLTKKLDF